MKQSFLDVLLRFLFHAYHLLQMNPHNVKVWWAVRRENRCTFRNWHRIGQPGRNIQEETDCLCVGCVDAVPFIFFVATRLIDPTNGSFFCCDVFGVASPWCAPWERAPTHSLTRTSFWRFRARSQQQHHHRPAARSHACTNGVGAVGGANKERARRFVGVTSCVAGVPGHGEWTILRLAPFRNHCQRLDE
jgi:hypothetical protein